MFLCAKTVRNGDFQSIVARSVSTVTPSEKKFIMTNKEVHYGLSNEPNEQRIYVASNKPHPAARSLCDS